MFSKSDYKWSVVIKKQSSKFKNTKEKYKKGAEQTQTFKKIEVGSGEIVEWASCADLSIMPCALCHNQELSVDN